MGNFITKNNKRYTKLLFFTSGFILIAVTIFSLQFFMDRLLMREANLVGMRSAVNVERNVKNLDEIFAGKTDKHVEIKILDRLSAATQIYSYEFLNPTGKVVYRAGSFHPPTDDTLVQHHGHSHDTKPVNSPVRSTASHHKETGAKKAFDTSDFNHYHTGFNNSSNGQTSVHGSPHTSSTRNIISLIKGDGITNPKMFAVVCHPVFKSGKFLGMIRVSVDQTEQHSIFNETITWLTVILLGVSALGFGIPSLFYMRGQKKIEAATKKVRFLAQHDEMTRLVNRKKFFKIVNDLLKGEENSGTTYALHFIDVDNLKTFNDTYGHDAGDELLRQISLHLKNSFSSKHIISRLGGDEFAVLQTDVNSDRTMEEFANQLLLIFSGSYHIKGLKVKTSASIGVALAQKGRSTCLDLLIYAEIAQRIVKSSGRAGFLIFEPDMKQRLDKRIALEETIRQANSAELFEVYYQPLFHTWNTQLCGFEALIRMKDKTGSYISPSDFIPVAEEIGLIDEIGLWVLESAVKSAANWPDHLFVAVNLSTRQFESGELVKNIETILEKNALSANRLELEITEGLLLRDSEWNLAQLREIKNLGISIAMDDFGVGHSSLAYLCSFPFDKIKIDQSFLRETGKNNISASMVMQTIIAMGHALKMEITVEGVETAEQLKLLQDYKCDCLQGFYLGHPQPESHLAPLLMKTFAGEIATDQSPSKAVITA